MIKNMTLCIRTMEILKQYNRLILSCWDSSQVGSSLTFGSRTVLGYPGLFTLSSSSYACGMILLKCLVLCRHTFSDNVKYNNLYFTINN